MFQTISIRIRSLLYIYRNLCHFKIRSFVALDALKTQVCLACFHQENTAAPCHDDLCKFYSS